MTHCCITMAIISHAVYKCTQAGARKAEIKIRNKRKERINVIYKTRVNDELFYMTRKRVGRR